MQFPEDEQALRGDVFTTMPMIVESFLRDFKKTIDMDVYVRVRLSYLFQGLALVCSDCLCVWPGCKRIQARCWNSTAEA